MYRSDSAHDAVERDSRIDPRIRKSDEIVIDRKPIVADRSRNENDDARVPSDRRRGERRRIERMGTDI